VTYDSISQYRQALSAQYEDAHPPLMSAVWRAINFIYPGTAGMLMLDLFLYWMGFGVLAYYCLTMTGRWVGVLALLGGLFPLVVSFSGVIWKDVLLASSWGLCCSSILLYEAMSKRSPVISKIVWWIAATSLL